MPLHANRLKERRDFWRMSQTDVADKLGLKHYEQYAQWETGKHQPSIKYIEQLAKVFNTTIDYLVGLVDEPGLELNESDLSDDEKVLITLKRQGLVNEAAVYVLSGRLPEQLPSGARLLIDSGNKTEVSGSEPAA